MADNGLLEYVRVRGRACQANYHDVEDIRSVQRLKRDDGGWRADIGSHLGKQDLATCGEPAQAASELRDADADARRRLSIGSRSHRRGGGDWLRRAGNLLAYPRIEVGRGVIDAGRLDRRLGKSAISPILYSCPIGLIGDLGTGDASPLGGPRALGSTAGRRLPAGKQETSTC